MGARGPQYADPASELIRKAFLDGYWEGRNDAYYESVKAFGNSTPDSAWAYSNTWYVHQDVLKQEQSQ